MYLLTATATTPTTLIPTITPSAAGLPGASFLATVASWVLWIALLSMVIMLCVHVIRWVAVTGENDSDVVASAKRAIGRVAVGTVVLGIGQTVLMALYHVS